jgi:trans-aconitate methyltransferase
MASQITGVDLSSKMLAVLQERYPDVSTFCGDFLDYTPAQSNAAAAAATSSGDDSSQQEQLQVI